LAGLLLAIPALETTGLLSCAATVFGSLRNGFYGLDTMLVEGVLRALAGEPRAEGATRIDPHALGRILGLDRGPEVKTIRRNITALAGTGRAGELQSTSGRKPAPPARHRSCGGTGEPQPAGDPQTHGRWLGPRHTSYFAAGRALMCARALRRCPANHRPPRDAFDPSQRGGRAVLAFHSVSTSQVLPSMSSRAASTCPAWTAVSVSTCRMTSRRLSSRQSPKSSSGHQAGAASRGVAVMMAFVRSICCRYMSKTASTGTSGPTCQASSGASAT